MCVPPDAGFHLICEIPLQLIATKPMQVKHVLYLMLPALSSLHSHF